MIFDLFHSLADPVLDGQRLGPARCFAQVLRQVRLAETLGAQTFWCAESHFSSEVQKKNARPVIPRFAGEVGLNADSFQLFHWLAAHTTRIGLGTAIHNIVGGSGGPIASADRVNTLRFYNRALWPTPRRLHVGVASGRFPYQNAPFGLIPRDADEDARWSDVQRLALHEALEIFLRLLRGEEVSSDDVQAVDPRHHLRPRWRFERLRLEPAPPAAPSGAADPDDLRIVLGSTDPEALAVARRFWNVDLFQLSFTPPAQIEALHAARAAEDATWARWRLPRTVLVFADPSRAAAYARADAVLRAYIEAMQGTARVPEKETLMARALIGDAAEIRAQLAPGGPRGFHPDDRLMLWFEFNQLDGEAIEAQMRYFFDEVAGKLAC